AGEALCEIIVGRDHPLFDFEHAPGAAQLAGADQRTGRIDIERSKTPREIDSPRFRTEDRVRAGQHPYLAAEPAIPARIGDTRAEHTVEQQRARGRNRKAALLARHAASREQFARKIDVARIVAEELFAEIVRHAAFAHYGHSPFDLALRTAHVAHADAETVAAMHAALELAIVTRRREHAHAGNHERRPVRIG